MPSYSKNDLVLVRYPFSDLSSTKVRPATIVSASLESQDLFILPLTSRTDSLLTGEFVLADWRGAGLNVPTAVKRGLYTVHSSLVIKSVGRLAPADAGQVDISLKLWLELG
ncbi:MAG: MazF family transcriptional regulator [Candidatus Latescibacteria bacterium]|nr:MazF family transcriptional regulator [Candidatus Latescibacterota bacterium]